MRLELERRLQDEKQNPEDRAGLTEVIQQHEEEEEEVCTEQNAQDKSCPFGFTSEEAGLPVAMPATPSFHFIPERLVVEENSCSSDMTESSCSSSDCDAGGGCSGGHSLPDVDGGLSRALSLCDSDSNNYSSYSHLSLQRDPVTQHSSSSATHSSTTDSTGPHTVDTFADNISRNSVTDYLDENANQPRDVFNDDSLDDFPNTPSPTVDYSFSRYMDLSLSSDSDLEFFDSDYPCGPLHSSFKGHRHPDSFRHLQLFSSVSLPQYESSTQLLESLIGLTEQNTE